MTSPSRRRVLLSVDLACVSHSGTSLFVLLESGARRAWTLPTAPWRSGSDLAGAAAALARATVGRPPSWCEQAGVHIADGTPSSAEAVVTFASIIRHDTPIPANMHWHDVAKLPSGIARRHAQSAGAAVSHIRRRMNQVPVAFQFLPPVFALGELQDVYEVLLGRRLHKASFRRALHAAGLVEATQKWRGDGRGRPAQLFRFAPRSRNTNKPPVRFDLNND